MDKPTDGFVSDEQALMEALGVLYSAAMGMSKPLPLQVQAAELLTRALMTRLANASVYQSFQLQIPVLTNDA